MALLPLLLALAAVGAPPRPSRAGSPQPCARSGAVLVSRGPVDAWDNAVLRLDRVERDEVRCHGLPLGERAAYYYLYPTGAFRRWDQAYQSALGVLVLEIRPRRRGGATATLTWMRMREQPDFCHFWVADPTDAAFDAAVAACWRAMGAPNGRPR